MRAQPMIFKVKVETKGTEAEREQQVIVMEKMLAEMIRLGVVMHGIQRVKSE